MRVVKGEESEPVGAAAAPPVRRRQGKRARGCSLLALWNCAYSTGLAKWGCGGGV